MNAFLLQYLPIVIFLAIACALGVAFIILPTVIAPKSPDAEKLSSYECGFNAFDDARMKFDVRFYLVSILFIIFADGAAVIALALELERRSAFDAAYVALAKRIGAELWTIDGPLARNAGARGHAVKLIPHQV